MSDSDVAEGQYYVNIAVGVSVALLTIISAALLVGWFRKRKGKQTKLVDNVAYNTHDCEIKTGTNEAYNAVDTNIITATNAAYADTSVQSKQTGAVNITTTTNEAYVATGVTLSVNPVYETVQTDDDNTTVTAEADTTLEYDYPRQDM